MKPFIRTKKRGYFSLNKLKSVSFSVTHLNYETKKVVFEKRLTSKVVFLKEKQETIGGIEIYTKRSFKKTIGFKKLLDLLKVVYAFAFVINDGKIYVFEDKLYLFGDYSKKSSKEIYSFDLKTAQWIKEGTLFRQMKKPAITKDKEFICKKMVK